jgi:hypothetical protein
MQLHQVHSFLLLLIKISYWHILFCFTKDDPLHDFSEADRIAAFETILPAQASFDRRGRKLPADLRLRFSLRISSHDGL